MKKHAAFVFNITHPKNNPQLPGEVFKSNMFKGTPSFTHLLTYRYSTLCFLVRRSPYALLQAAAAASEKLCGHPPRHAYLTPEPRGLEACSTTPQRPTRPNDVAPKHVQPPTADVERALLSAYDCFPLRPLSSKDCLDMFALLRGCIAIARDVFGKSWAADVSIMDGGCFQKSKHVLTAASKAVCAILHNQWHWALFVWKKDQDHAVIYDGKFDGEITNMGSAVAHAIASSTSAPGDKSWKRMHTQR